MNDMLVRLVSLPDITRTEKVLKENEQVIFRRPIAPEKSIVTQWVSKQFSNNWADEVDVAFSRIPISCFIAQRGQEIIGFSCYECTAKNFFGPTGIIEKERGKGIGKVLLLKALLALKELGYGYAIIGGVGPVEYYQKTVNAIVIDGSEISIYQHMLKNNL